MKQGQLYMALASAGRAHGYPVSVPAVHLWIHRGLLPACRVEHLGFGKIRTALDPEAETRLLAICRYRFDEHVGRLDWIAALLWLDGHDLPVELVREALRNEVRRHSKSGRIEWPRGRALDVTAKLMADWAPIAAVMPGTDQSTRADLAFAILQRIASPHVDAPSDNVIESIAQAVGSTPESVRSWFRSGSPAPDLRVAIEAPDEAYEAARLRWQVEGQAAWPRSRSRKSRLRVRRLIDGFVAALITTQMTVGSS